MSDPALALADALFGREPEEKHQLLGKLWARVGTGRGSELHVRVGWVAGTEFVQAVGNFKRQSCRRLHPPILAGPLEPADRRPRAAR